MMDEIRLGKVFIIIYNLSNTTKMLLSCLQTKSGGHLIS